MKQHWIRPVLGIATVFVTLLFGERLISCNPTSQTEAAPAPNPSVSVNSLTFDYDQNEVAADHEYKGKVMQIQGEVDSINKDFSDDIYIMMMSTSVRYAQLHADLADTETNKAASLRKGQQISLTCKIGGKVLTDVTAENCVIND